VPLRGTRPPYRASQNPRGRPTIETIGRASDERHTPSAQVLIEHRGVVEHAVHACDATDVPRHDAHEGEPTGAEGAVRWRWVKRSRKVSESASNRVANIYFGGVALLMIVLAIQSFEKSGTLRARALTPPLDH